MISKCDYEYDIGKWFLILDHVVLVIVSCVKICVGYDVDIMIRGFDYYIGFIDCVIWLCVLGRMDGKNWKGKWKILGEDGKWWKKMEDRGFGVECCNCNKYVPPNVRVYRYFLAM